jgi:hypothetical protein
MFSIVLGTFVNGVWGNYDIDLTHFSNILLLLPTMWLEVLLLCISISLLRVLTLNIARISGDSRLRNAIIFFTFSIFYYVMLALWPIITIAAKRFAVDLVSFSIHANVQIYLTGVKLIIFDAVRDLQWSMLLPNVLLDKVLKAYRLSSFQLFETPENYRLEAAVLHFARFNMAFIPGLFRLTISVVFLTSFLLRPLIMRPTLFVWERIVDSDKPVFTLVFGGLAALAGAVAEIAKHL